MKKIIAILGFFLFAVALMAQDKVINNYGLAGVTNAVAARKTAAYNYVFQVNVQSPYFYALQVRQNDEGGVPANNTSAAYLQGSVDGTNYVNIDTLSYAGSGTYEVSTLTSFKKYDGEAAYTLPLAYKYLRVNVTPSDTIWIKSIWLNVLPIK